MRSRPALLALALAALTPTVARAATPERPAPVEDARRLAAMLDYVAGDYGEAVAGGAVVDAHEWEEQLEFLAEARRLADRLPQADLSLAHRLAALEAEARAHVGADLFAADARAIRREIVATFAIQVAPHEPPVYARGAALYAEHCASCHGATGAADTAAARALEPAPRNFRDGEVMASVTPSRAYNAITDGVEGTAMTAFPALSEQDRWDLAFAVTAMRFDDAEAARGLGGTPALSDLADRTDAELVGRLPASPAERAAAVAWLRRTAPYTARAPQAR